MDRLMTVAKDGFSIEGDKLMKTVIAFAAAVVTSAAMASDQGLEEFSSDFSKFDTNSDETIEMDEAQGTSLEEYFAVIDLNNDDQISRLEFNEYIKTYPSIVKDSPMKPKGQS